MDLELDLFGSRERLAEALALADERLMPLLHWLDALEDPQRRRQISAALLVLLVRRWIVDLGAPLDFILARVAHIHEAVVAGELDGLLPPERQH